MPKKKRDTILVEAALLKQVHRLEAENEQLRRDIDDALKFPSAIYSMLFPQAIDGPKLMGRTCETTIMAGLRWLRTAAGLKKGQNADQQREYA